MENKDHKQTTENHEIIGERGLPPVNSAKRGGSAVNKIGMIVVGIIALMAILAVNGVFTKKAEKSGPGKVVEEDKKSKIVRSNLPELPAALEKTASSSALEPELKPFVPKVIRTADATPQKPRFTVIEDKNKEITPDQRKRQGGLFADLGSSDHPQNPPAHPQSEIQFPGADSSGASFNTDEGKEDDSKSLAVRLTPTEMVGVSASLLPDRNFLVTQGTFIDCALETAISSDLPGFVSCRATRDIYSTNGNVLLMERGSKIVGQYQGGLKRGQARIFAVWNRVETPSGVIVGLDSPGTDALGRSGHGGDIDKHFWERFGGAILLSVIDDLGNTAATAASDNNGVQIGSTTGAAQEGASIALENSINIPPTLYKNQGEHISIFVARDLDFRSVYDLAVDSH